VDILALPLEEMVPARLLARRAEAFPDRALVTFAGGSTLTYAAVDRTSSRLANALRPLVRNGGTVALFLPNTPVFVHSYFALSKLGAVAVPINTAYRGYMLEYVLNDTQCGLAFVDLSLLDRMREVENNLPDLSTLVVQGLARERLDEAQQGFQRIRLMSFDALLEDRGVESHAGGAEWTCGDLNCIIYTSGTTGPSKGVPITNAHAVVKALEVVRVCGYVQGDVVYSPLPLFHSMALLRGVVAAVVSGTSIVLRDRFSASQFWGDVRRFGVTIVHCVFTIPRILKKAPPGPDDRDHQMRCMYNAQYDPDFEERFGVKLVEGYGLTEAGVAMFMRSDDPPRPGSCGRVSEEWEVRLVDEQGREVGVGEPGEILLRPKKPFRIMPGYHNKPEATVQAFRDLWFHTGDLATIDADGYYYFKDRKKDAIRRRGENISSWEVEQILIAHPAVEEAAALPYRSAVGEDDVRVVIVRRPGYELSAEELVAYCVRRMPEFMVPRYIEFRAVLPRTPTTGRVEKHRLREEALPPDHYDRGERTRSRVT